MPKGRPREFDADAALDKAMTVFWRHGYEGTSLALVAQAMGVNMPSVYAAYGNKEALFRKVVDRYLQGPASYLPDALKEPTARKAAERLIAGAIDMAMNPRNPDGCLLVQGALASGPQSREVREDLCRRRAGAEKALRKRFKMAVTAGDLPTSADVAQLARYLITVVWGMSVQAAGGASRAQLKEVADLAMKCWPL